jgi:hypothetical protein
VKAVKNAKIAPTMRLIPIVVLIVWTGVVFEIRRYRPTRIVMEPYMYMGMFFFIL